MHEQDEEADGGADGDDDAFAVDGAARGILRRADAGAFAGVVEGVVVVAPRHDASVVVVVIGEGVPPEIILGAHGRERACDCETEP